MPNIFDVIIIGSGAAGVTAATPLIEAGLSIAMVDGGTAPNFQQHPTSNTTFEELRSSDTEQWQLFLGQDLSALKYIHDSHGKQMTSGNKSFIVKHSQQLPIITNNLEILQSLGQGGLSQAWGAVCDIFTNQELNLVGLPSLKTMKKHYQEVITQIGVSGKKAGFKLQPTLKVNEQAEDILRVTQSGGSYWRQNQLSIFKPMMAVLSKSIKKRRAVSYSELEFWGNQGQTMYKPDITLSELKSKKNFKYLPGYIVQTVTDKPAQVLVSAQGIETDTPKVFKARCVILAAGSINTCRILLSSFKAYDQSIPFITKPHTLTSYLNLKFLLRPQSRRVTGLCQLVISHLHKHTTDVSAQFYSYKSLLWYKLLPFIPLPTPLALTFLSLVGQALLVSDNRYAWGVEKNNTLTLRRRKTQEYLDLHYSPDPTRLNQLRNSIHRIQFGLLRMGIIPLKTVSLAHGSTAHYAGGIPVREKKGDELLSVNSQGQLWQASNIYVADSSTWSYLPAKPLTLTIMANANRIGHLVAKQAFQRK